MIDFDKKLIYQEKSEMAEFYAISPLFHEFYRSYLHVKDSPFNFKFTHIHTFDTACYLCTIIINDTEPEMYTRRLYDLAKEEMGGWRYAGQLVWNIVHTILSLIDTPCDNVLNFIADMEGLPMGEDYENEFLNLIDKLKCGNARFSKEMFKPQPFNPAERHNISWKWQTKEYEQLRIKKIVYLWDSNEDRITIAKEIRAAFERDMQESAAESENNEYNLPF